jgi:CRP/FNR family transcriptional regulator
MLFYGIAWMSRKIGMNRSWPCAACPVRDIGFCGALLGQHSSEQRLNEQPAWQDFRGLRGGENIITRGNVSDYVYVLCDGWAFRYYRLPDGRRQILQVLLAGDIFSAVTAFAEKLNFSVQAMTEVRISRFQRIVVKSKFTSDPRLTDALARSFIDQGNDLDELVTVLGQRSAEQRLAYLFLHFIKRLRARIPTLRQFPFPLRQQHIAEMMGLTPVHVSRVMSSFRERKLIDLSGGVLTVLDPDELERIGSLR